VVKPFGGMFTDGRMSFRVQWLFSRSRSSTRKDKYKGITVLPVRVLAYVLIRATQRGLLRLEKLDKHKTILSVGP
jgi:hypothetical protein